jgi:hypothetical protein
MWLNKIFSAIEQTHVTPRMWLATFLGIVIVRTFLENIAGLRTDAALTTNIPTLIHFVLYWFVMAVVLMIVISCFTKKNIVTVSKVVLIGLLLILIAPVIGYIITFGQGVPMTYLQVSSISDLPKASLLE